MKGTAVLALLSVSVTLTALPSALVADTSTSSIVATEIRQAGYACDAPKNPVRDAAASKPGRVVWIIQCQQGTYRVTLNQDGTAQVEQGD